MILIMKTNLVHANTYTIIFLITGQIIRFFPDILWSGVGQVFYFEAMQTVEWQIYLIPLFFPIKTYRALFGLGVNSYLNLVFQSHKK